MTGDDGDVTETCIKNLCDLYGLVATVLVRELSRLSVAFKSVCIIVDLCDFQTTMA